MEGQMIGIAKAEQVQEMEATIHDLSSRCDKVMWYLGEERSRRKSAEERLHTKDLYIARLEEENHQLKTRWEQAEWYLGEAKGKITELEARLKAI